MSKVTSLDPQAASFAGLQTFAAEADRRRLTATAARAVTRLAASWAATNAEAASLLGVSESTWDRIKAGRWDGVLSQDQLTRASALIGIFKGLHLLFADSMADRWPGLVNRGPIFDRRSPIQAMIEGGIPRMIETRQISTRFVAASEGGAGDSFSLVREAFPYTVRLVASARLRAAVLAPLADNEDALAALAEIEGATSGRLIAEERGAGALTAAELVHGVPHARFINASFAYAKPRQPMRFNPAERGAWYAALGVETCIAEVGYHLSWALADAGDFNAVVDYAEMHASMSGLFVDLRPLPDHASLHPDPAIGYPAGNIVAAMARGEGHNGIIYPSVRDPGGTCIAALWPNVVQSVAQGAMHRLVWAGTAAFSVEAL